MSKEQMITVAGLSLTCTLPYEEGHVISANEAQALNQTRAENLRNNFASQVKKAVKEAEEAGAEVDLEAVQAAFSEYDSEYVFGVRRSAVFQDPIAKEAHSLAMEAVKQALKARGHKLADFSKEQMDGLAAGLVEAHPEYTERATRIVAETNAVAGIDLSDMLDSI